ncbi:MAG: hypothetical protein SGI73_20290 [Chloroflexota bacterium]|nr:hypothetical protein [Chloroflexota bacterium]
MKKLLRLVVGIIVVGFVLYSGYFLYLGPKVAGDNYVRALQAGDSLAVRDSVCQDSLFSSVLGSGSGVLAAIGVTPGGEVRNIAYTPFGRSYTFDWVFGGAVGVDVSTPIRLLMDTAGAFRFCVREIASNT